MGERVRFGVRRSAFGVGGSGFGLGVRVRGAVGRGAVG